LLKYTIVFVRPTPSCQRSRKSASFASDLENRRNVAPSSAQNDLRLRRKLASETFLIAADQVDGYHGDPLRAPPIWRHGFDKVSLISAAPSRAGLRRE